jgi:prephenate dehydrogenase
MTPKRLSILGVGLLGGSIGLAAKAAITNCVVVGYGHRQSTLDAALAMGAIDEGASDPAEAVAGADRVFLCTPVGLFEEMLRKIAPVLAPGAIVTDVGSTKRSVVRAAEEILPAHARFVGSHPMAGGEKRGVEFARADLFRHAVCILTPTAKTDAGALAAMQTFWRDALGMRLATISPEDHDRLLCDVSHLPHAVAAALVAMQDDRALDLCGKGFIDSTRIASGDGGLWRDILLDNRDNLRAGIQRLQAQLGELLAKLDDEKSADLQRWLAAAAQRRDELIRKRLREFNPE